MKQIITILLLITIFNFASAQFNEFFVPNTVDARSFALGRTEIMSADGSNAIFSNPALLGTISGQQLQFGGCIKAFDLRSDLIDERAYDYKNKFAIAPKINHISFAMPYELSSQDFKLGLGAGFYTAMDNTFKLNSEYQEKDYDINVAEFNSYTGGLNLLTISGAINYKDRYFAGLSLNKSLYSTLGYNGKVEFEDFGDATRTQKTKISASSFCFGAYAKITPEFSVGLNYRSKFEMEVDDTEWEEEDSDGDQNEGEYTNADIDIPSFWGIGVQYKLNSGTTLIGEYQSRPFSDYQEGSNKVFGDIDDGDSYRFGIEFSQSMPIYRLGLFYDAMPITDDGEDKPKSMLGLTGGIQFDLSNFLIDSYLEYGNIKQESKFSNEKYDSTFSKFSIGISLKYFIDGNSNKGQSKKINSVLE